MLTFTSPRYQVGVYRTIGPLVSGCRVNGPFYFHYYSLSTRYPDCSQQCIKMLDNPHPSFRLLLKSDRYQIIFQTFRRQERIKIQFAGNLILKHINMLIGNHYANRTLIVSCTKDYT